MTARSALHTAGKVTSAADARLAQAATWAKNGISVRTGVVYAGVNGLITSTATMDVMVQPLHFVAKKADAEGVYVGANDAPYALTIAAAPGTGSRMDKVYIMQKDSNAGVTSPDATTAPFIGATSGSLPAGAVQIGTVTITAGSTSMQDAGVTIATTCQWTVPAGVPIPVRNATERNALTPFEGLRAQRLDQSSVVDVYTNGAWVVGDTGWQTPPTVTGWTSSVNYPVQIRRQGNKVSLRGAVVRGSGATNSLLTLDPQFRPAANKLLNAVVASGGTSVVTPNVATSGTVAITYQTTGVPVGDTLPLDAEWLTD